MALFAKKGFSGGVHPPEKKELTADKSIRVLTAGKQITVMLSQHIGAVCEPLVEKGSEVQAGQKIGDAEAFVSAAVHSPVSGKVKEISLQPHLVIGRSPGIVIEVNENNTPKQPCADKFADFNEDAYSVEQILEAVADAGLVGMGGAGFPTRVKIDPKAAQKEVMIVNGCECEPYITCDTRVMLEWSDQVLAGIRLTRKAAGCQRVFVAIEDNKPQAAEAMRQALARAGCSDIPVVELETKYPQGGERQLINSVLAKQVPTGSIPPQIGVLVSNVATMAALAEATVLGNPLTWRVVTVTGEGIAEPGNYYVPIGMSIGELIEHCGGLTENAAKVISGGPMMGIAVADLSTPVTKTTGAVTVLTEAQIGQSKFAGRRTACIRCGRCVGICPERLVPTMIAHAVKNGDLDLAQKYFISACIECGCCSYICPANIELTGHIKTGKILLARKRKRIPS